ncbi:CoxG family protein [Oceanobacillus massiliensis]|uniref:CoxG family protein n=1 Tax=Oceanobacillus massiliensis TaxID=1465765 RepID=UPI000289DFCD|nr:SRPBCC family protein [Oceanobacillus massiliensis]
MPNGKHTVQVDRPIDAVWDFVSDINNWAPLVPGYIEHEIINEKQSTWKFVSDIGVIRRKLYMKVNITEWREPTKVTFDLKGINEKFSGSGYFEAEKVTDSSTLITGYLEIKPGGVLAPALKPALRSVLPKTAAGLTEAIANQI